MREFLLKTGCLIFTAVLGVILFRMLAFKAQKYKCAVAAVIFSLFAVSLAGGYRLVFPSREAAPQPANVQVLNESRKQQAEANEIYNEGLKAFNDKDYCAAIAFFAMVAPGDDQYMDARAMLEAAKARRDGQLLAEGKRKMAEGDFRGAIKVFETALANNPDLLEAQELKRRAEQKAGASLYDAVSGPSVTGTAQSGAPAKTEGSGSGPLGFSVKQTKVSSSVETSLGFNYGAGENINGQYVWLYISAVNNWSSPASVDPDDFTLASTDGYMSTRNEATFALADYLKKSTLAPGQSASGWLIFYMPRGNEYILRYYGAGGLTEKQVNL